MKRIFKKNQLVLTLLAVMLAVAGYLNYISRNGDDPDASPAGAEISNENMAQENRQAAQPDDLVPSDEPGSAIFTNAQIVEFIAGLTLEKEQMRASNRAIWQEIIDNPSVESAQKQSAIDAMVRLTDIEARENAAQALLATSGFDNAIVSITDEQVDVVLGMTELTDAQRAQIEDIVKRKTGIGVDGMIISLMKKQV